MKKISLSAALLASLALAGCGGGGEEQLGNDVQLEPIEVNETGDLNMLSDDAANVAAEAEQLEQQAQELTNAVENASENATGPQTPADENIQGM